MDVGVLLEVLCQGESLEAEDANVLLDRRVGGDVSSEGEACCVGLVTALDFAFIRSLHRNRIVLTTQVFFAFDQIILLRRERSKLAFKLWYG